MSISSIGTAGGPFPSDYVSEIKRLSTDTPGVKYEDWSPELKERVAESKRRSEAGLQSDREMEEAAKVTPNEVWFRSAPNVGSLNKEQSLDQIEYMSELIQSGEADKLPLVAANGNQTTANYRQYVYWLKEHVKQLDGAQTGTDVKA